MAQRNAAILGATGLTGSFLLPLLCDTYDSVTVIGRRETGLARINISEQVTDFTTEWSVDLTAVSDLFITFGTTRKAAGSAGNFKKIDLDIPLRLAQMASKAGVKNLVLVSAVGANSRSTMLYSRVKGELEDAVSALGFESFIILRPSLLLGGHKGRVLESMAQRVIGPLVPLISPSYRPVVAKDLAMAMMKALSLPKGIHKLEGKSLWKLINSCSSV